MNQKQKSRIKNPLHKRIARELKQELGKNIAIFIFIAATIGFISGFYVADNSMRAAYDGSFEKYNIEDGNFELDKEISDEVKEKIEEYANIYENFYVEKEIDDQRKVRIFTDRKEVNRVCVIDGKLPDEKNQIALDRLFSQKSNLKIGDMVTLGGTDYKITGMIALPDYSALFSDNNDLMFDATHFGVGIVSEDQFETYKSGKVFYSYSWKIHAEDGRKKSNDLTDEQKEKINEEIKNTLIEENAGIVNFVAEPDNQAIHFTGNDMGSDKSMVTVLLYVIIVILAFIFAITTISTIDKESAVIGTLRASGYTKGEMLRHYMVLPIMVTLIASIVGNILGYTVFKFMVVDMYYNSYSLTTYETLWNADAFIMTTIIPAIVMIIVNLLVLNSRLKLSPLKFLRHDLKKNKNSKALKLPPFSFMMRFKLRIIIQNMPNYIMLFVGILFAGILALFGLMMIPLLNHNGDEIINNMKGNYQYILKMPVEIDNENAEKCIMGSLVNDMKGTRKDEITVYGIEKKSKYFSDIKLMDDAKSVVVSEAVLEKYKLKVEDKIKVKSEFTDTGYEFVIGDSYYYPQGLAIFMNSDRYREVFELDKDFFNAYLSDEKLDEIDEHLILTKITRTDMLKVTSQLNDSFGGMMPMLAGFAVLMSVLIIYLLSKVVIEKNTGAISMVKILGYSDREVSRLYVTATGIAAFLSAVISIPISYYVMKELYYMFMVEFSGWVSYYVKPIVFVQVFALTMVSYVIVAAFLYQKIRKIPMNQALKNVEL
ncbi:MAG: ABC transporter permease [Lachnospiraceae bacterium]|nr:ABC transporter permease [Lachnospiraceae bacterium]